MPTCLDHARFSVFDVPIAQAWLTMHVGRLLQAAMSRMMKHLVHGAADTDNPAHWELHTFCDTLVSSSMHTCKDQQLSEQNLDIRKLPAL